MECLVSVQIHLFSSFFFSVDLFWDPSKVHTLQLVDMPLESLLIYRFIVHYLSLAIYFFAKVNHVFCKVSHRLDFADYIPVKCSSGYCISFELVVTSRDWIKLCFRFLSRTL